MHKRVVVTGVGLVTPLGAEKDSFRGQLFGGGSGIRPITLFDTARFDSKLGAQVCDFTPLDFIRPATLRRMDRLSQMITAASRMALEDAAFQIGPHNRDRVGVVMGTCFGSTDVAAQFAKVLFTDSPRRANPILVPNTVMNAPAGPSLAMTRALTASRINPGEIDYVCAAANGGWRSDRLEAEALSRVFATSGSQPRISALKGTLGESFSSGGIRAAAMAISIQNQTLAPTLGLSQPLTPLNLVLKAQTQVPIRYGLLNGVSSGGTFAAVIMKNVILKQEPR